METTEKPEQKRGGATINNYFQGATINNLVINGNMTKSGPDQFHNESKPKMHATEGQVAQALMRCAAYIWGNAAYSVAFCTLRDAYDWGDNATDFERKLAGQGISIPEGTVNSAMFRNPWMKYHIDKWEENQASERAIKLRDMFKQMLGEIVLLERKTA